MKRLLLPLLAALALPNFVRANPAIYAPQICTMLQSNISINKAWTYVTEVQRQQILARERTFGYGMEVGALSGAMEVNKTLGGMYGDVMALTLSQCPDYFWQGWANNDGSGIVIKNPGSFGFISVLINGKRYITVVLEGGDFFAKGIKPGSIILSINNVDITNFSHKEFVKMLSKIRNVGEKATFLIEYKGEQKIYELTTVPSENIKWAKGTRLKIKKSKIKKNSSSGSIKVNCDSPVWKNKPRCN